MGSGSRRRRANGLLRDRANGSLRDRLLAEGLSRMHAC